MAAFSWSDGFRAAFGSCLPCFPSAQAHPRDDAQNSAQSNGNDRQSNSGLWPGTARYDELEGLLGDSGDTDAEAERMSLHSDVGQGGRKKRRKTKKRRTGRSIRLFGFDLFGRQPAIQLSDSDDDDERSSERRRRRLSRLLGNPAANASSSSGASGSAFDSDAAPLDASTIAQHAARASMSPPPVRSPPGRGAKNPAVDGADDSDDAEDRLRREKQERRRRREERRQLRRAAQAVALGVDETEFEGFQGSGPGVAHAPSPFSPHSATSHTSSGFVPPHEDFGAYVSAGGTGIDDGLEDGGDADFGGEAYARQSRARHSDSSRSQSQTSASQSQSNADRDPAVYNHHYLSHGAVVSLNSPPIPEYGGMATQPEYPQHVLISDVPQARKKKRRSDAGSKKSGSSTSQSASVATPQTSPVPGHQAPPFIVSDYQAGAPSPGAIGGFNRIPAQDSKFPSVGFGGLRRNSSDAGVFLAIRGEE